jgi:hypothetical protein
LHSIFRNFILIYLKLCILWYRSASLIEQLFFITSAAEAVFVSRLVKQLLMIDKIGEISIILFLFCVFFSFFFIYFFTLLLSCAPSLSSLISSRVTRPTLDLCLSLVSGTGVPGAPAVRMKPRRRVQEGVAHAHRVG